VLKNTAFQIPAVLKPPVERQPFQVELVHELPHLPVLPETLLLLELKVQESCVDLREISQLVLGDLGATLQILRLAGREYGNSDGRPVRIEDCISDLGLHACLEAVSAQTVARDGRRHAVAAAWSHSREIAQYAKLVAEDLPDVNPEEAYLVGLLHTTGLLPAILGWSRAESAAADTALAGFRIANRWALPLCVVEFFCEIHLPGYGTRWSRIVRTAHQVANRSSISCPFERDIRPHLQ
jgi:HD-like signal output (HDOD) protein